MTAKRVTGLGGIFFKAQDRPRLLAWYREHRAIDPEGNKFELWQPPEAKT